MFLLIFCFMILNFIPNLFFLKKERELDWSYNNYIIISLTKENDSRLHFDYYKIITFFILVDLQSKEGQRGRLVCLSHIIVSRS